MSRICKGGSLTVVRNLIENLAKTGRSRKQALSIAVDSTLVVISLWAAYSLRAGGIFLDFRPFLYLFPLLVVSTILLMVSLGVYRWKIRSSTRTLYYELVKASAGSALFFVVLTHLFPPEIDPRSIFIIYGVLLACGTCTARIFWQELFDSERDGEPVAIYGAGEAGANLLRALNQGSDYRPVLLLDDNPELTGTKLAGLTVVRPNFSNINDLLTEGDIGRVILAMPSINAADYEHKVQIVRKAGFIVQTIPTYAELVSGEASYNQVRDVSINDILGRSEVPPNEELLGKRVTGLVVLVTGAGGSIGSELCRQILAQRPAVLVALDQGEENLYKLTEELSAKRKSLNLPESVLVSKLCSVADTENIDALMKFYSFETVFHAAAYKHVPIVEAQPEQGVSVNVFGTLNILDASIKHKVRNFVLISTDKAVRPTNSMGATKRIAELISQAKSQLQDSTRISMVRFGNVLGSSGSVVPKFQKQICEAGPITLTDPDITRYFMTIPEAAQLVLQACSIAKGGDVFVLDMGEPVRIEDLAISMVRLSGKRLQRETGNKNDIEIVVEGLRPGEKMHEELFTSDFHDSTVVQKIFTADEVCMKWPELRKELDNLSTLSSVSDRSKLRAKLLDLAFYGQVATVTSETASSSSHKTVTKKIKPRHSLPAPHASTA